MNRFVFDTYLYDKNSGRAEFSYKFEDGHSFTEVVEFKQVDNYDESVLGSALFLAFILIGTSYYKTFPSREVLINTGSVDQYQASFFSSVYQDGLSQFAYENSLTREDLAHFIGESNEPTKTDYKGEGVLALQSGGKDSLLLASLLKKSGQSFTPWHLSSSDKHPAMLDDLGEPLITARRIIDKEALDQVTKMGGKNGHVPISYIVMSIALIQSILLNKKKVLISIAHEGEEPHASIGDMPVTHQWSKTWAAEKNFAEYVSRYVSSDIQIGSPLRRFSELKVAELFVENSWEKFGHRFSSCNIANYKQGSDNNELRWCGECPKCANSFLLFAPFADTDQLKSLFGGQDLFEKPMLLNTFKGLLGIDGVMKPFECVGEIDELRYAYHQALEKGGYKKLPFDVPESDFDYEKEYPYQNELNV